MTNEVLEKLEDLLVEDQFELIGIEENESGGSGEYRLVYLMNDAVESFLVFKNAKLTGIYEKDYEGALDVLLQETETGYALIVHQGESVCTLFFEDLVLENHFYNYGEVGHCWVEGFENIRVLEYQIAIMRDKYDYLGADSCTPLEQMLSELRDFPPLNQSCYPAVPEKHLVEREDKWELTEEAADVMRKLALEAGDEELVKKLAQYEKQQQGFLATALWQSRTRSFAKLFQQPEHSGVLKLLAEKIKEATACYPTRTFPEEEVRIHNQMMAKAKKRAEELHLQEMEIMIYHQEPFQFARDSIDYEVFLVIQDRKGNVSVEIIE